MKNPLYVVKGQQVEQAKDWFDLFVKKFDLEPVVAFLEQLLSMLMAQINSYPAFLAVKGVFDQVMEQVQMVLKPFLRS